MSDPVPAYVPASHAVRVSRWVAVLSVLALVVLGLVWERFFNPLRPNGSWLILKVLPLCIPLVGLMKNRMYTYRWVSLLIWLYFTEGVVRAYSEHGASRYCALAEIALCLLLFVACTVHVRVRFRNVKRAALTHANAAP